MADRYWVGGTANWDGTAGTKWSATSGGPGGASVPTSADDVFFNASSTGTVTISSGNTGAKSINCTGFTGTITGSTAGISVAGSITLAAGMTFSYTGTLSFTGTATLITAGKTFSGISINTPGVTLTLGDALNMGNRTLTIDQGTFDTSASGYNVTGGSIVSSNTNARTITLNNSTVTLSSNLNFSNSTNLTFNAGTSSIICSASTVILEGGSQTFYNFSLTGTLVSGTKTINGANTFNNLTSSGPSGAGRLLLIISADQTINGTLTAAGPTVLRRMFIRSSDPDTIRTITAASVSADDCDFESITIAGAASPIAPTRAGDCGGNSGITFPAAKTVYRVGTNTTWAGSSSWALTSGGTGDDNNFPLPQDTAIINDDTTLTGTLGLTTYNIGTFDCSTRTTGITINYNNSARWHGSHTLSSAITVLGTSTQTFAGRGLIDLTSAGKTITFAVTVASPTGTFRLMDAFNGSTSSCAIIVNNGTFNANNYNVTCFQFGSGGAALRTVTMGSGLWTVGGTSVVWNTGTTTNLTFNKDTADILLSNTTTTARSFLAGALSFNKLTIGGTTGTSTTTLSLVSSTSFTELASTKTVAHTIRFSATTGGTISVWSVTGTVGNVVTIDSNTAGVRRSFTLSNITSRIDYLSVKDIGELSGDKFYVGANSIDGGNNSNVYFTNPPSDGNIPFLFFFG
jgi:hypothetical protein